MPAAPAPSAQSNAAPLSKWHRRVFGFCLIVFAFELGVFLIVFPWLKNWDLSWIAVHSARFSDLWMNRYFRGALSGLGVLNVYIALVELVRQLRSIFRPPRS